MVLAEAGSETASAHLCRRRRAGTFKRVLRYGDGWIPSLGGAHDSDALKLERFSELAALARAEGRAPFPITTNATPRDHAAIETLEAAGVTRCLFGLKSAPADRSCRVSTNSQSFSNCRDWFHFSDDRNAAQHPANHDRPTTLRFLRVHGRYGCLNTEYRLPWRARGSSIDRREINVLSACRRARPS